jgi:alpha-L-rhamnosidase
MLSIMTHFVLRGFRGLLLVGLLANLGMPFASASNLPAPTELSVGPFLVDPLGYGERSPQFSWKLLADPEGLMQSGFQIVCASERSGLENAPDLWDSGWVSSGESTFVDYAGEPLESRDSVYWRVRYRDADGRVSEWSRVAHFEIALLDRQDWQAEWIFLPEDEPAGTPPAPYFRKTFELNEGEVVLARVYVSARGIYELQINGQRVGDDVLQPEWTDYAKRSIFGTYDVTELLREGDNALGAVLGEMWYTGVFGHGVQRNKYGEIPEFLMQLEVTFADGTRQTIVTDETWRATRTGPIVYSNIYHGERYDARLELGDWSSPGFDDKDWKSVSSNGWDDSVELWPRPHQPVRIIETRCAVSMSEAAEDRYIFDFGQNMSGWARIRVPSEPGRVYTLRFAEMLQEDGSLYTANYRAAEATDTYTCATSGEIVWEPSFTFRGFRYVELSGLPEGMEPDPGWVSGVVVHNDMPPTGSFVSSDERLNQLQSNIQWGQRSNFLAVPTDCPQRDERKGWTGDAQVFSGTANYNFNTLAFFVKWCQDLRDSQYETGAIPYWAPNFPNRPQKVSSGWGDACVIVPWNAYESFGYKRILEENYAMMRDWIRYYRESPETEGLIYRG